MDVRVDVDVLVGFLEREDVRTVSYLVSER